MMFTRLVSNAQYKLALLPGGGYRWWGGLAMARWRKRRARHTRHEHLPA
jgi:hypothetical protein